MRMGDAKLLIRGKLLSAEQNASVLLTDFPVAVLQPLFRSMPALQNAPPAAGTTLAFQGRLRRVTKSRHRLGKCANGGEVPSTV